MGKRSFDINKNAFDILRWFSAISVMMLHYTWYAKELTPEASQILTKIREVIKVFPGVVILFTISGFLVSYSFENSESLILYLKKRVIRMYPDLWLCTLLNLIIIALIVPYLLDGSEIFKWILTQTIGIANTPACLKGFATGSINGALWTVFTEIQLYILLGVLFPLISKFSMKKWALILAGLFVCNIGCKEMSADKGAIIAKIIERIFLPYAIWFFIGVFCYIKRKYILNAIKKLTPFLLITYIVIKAIGFDISGYYASVSESILLPFIAIGLAYSLPTKRISFDLTYQIFLYHWIVINLMVHFNVFGTVNWLIAACVFITGTFMLAYSSKYIIYKLNALRKNVGGGITLMGSRQYFYSYNHS